MAGLQPDVYASIFITMAAASTALALRLIARRMTKVPLWYDDYFAVVAFVSGPWLRLSLTESQMSLVGHVYTCVGIDFDLEVFAVAYCTAVTICKTPLAIAFPGGGGGIFNP